MCLHQVILYYAKNLIGWCNKPTNNRIWVNKHGYGPKTKVMVCVYWVLTRVSATFLHRSGVQESGIFQATCDIGLEASWLDSLHKSSKRGERSKREQALAEQDKESVTCHPSWNTMENANTVSRYAIDKRLTSKLPLEILVKSLKETQVISKLLCLLKWGRQDMELSHQWQHVSEQGKVQFYSTQQTRGCATQGCTHQQEAHRWMCMLPWLQPHQPHTTPLRHRWPPERWTRLA